MQRHLPAVDTFPGVETQLGKHVRLQEAAFWLSPQTLLLAFGANELLRKALVRLIQPIFHGYVIGRNLRKFSRNATDFGGVYSPPDEKVRPATIQCARVVHSLTLVNSMAYP